MNYYINYKGYYGTVEHCSESDILHGQIAGIYGLFMYHGDSLENLKIEFRDTVERYLAYCKETGINPETSFVPNADALAV